MNSASPAAKPLAPTAHIVKQPRPVREVLSFPPFVLDLGDERLWAGGRPVPLRRKPFAVLSHLARNPYRLVRHDELMDVVWGNAATCESLLRTHVREVRHALGRELVETVVGRGYRFIANVTRLPGSDPETFNDASATLLVERTHSREVLRHHSVRVRAHPVAMRLRLATVRAVADELERSMGDGFSEASGPLLKQLAEELEQVVEGLRAWGQLGPIRVQECTNETEAERRGG